MSSLADYVKEEKKRLEQESEEYRKQNDLPGFWIPKKGENHFEVLDIAPRTKDFGQGERIVFRVKVFTKDKDEEGKDVIVEAEKDWAFNPSNPAYSEFINLLEAGINFFVMLRTGEKKGTRYEFLKKKE